MRTMKLNGPKRDRQTRDKDRDRERDTKFPDNIDAVGT